jgi:hypothetical protein
MQTSAIVVFCCSLHTIGLAAGYVIYRIGAKTTRLRQVGKKPTLGSGAKTRRYRAA